MSGPGNARRPAGQAEAAPRPMQRSRRYRGLRDFPATDQAIRGGWPGVQPRAGQSARPAPISRPAPGTGRQDSSHG